MTNIRLAKLEDCGAINMLSSSLGYQPLSADEALHNLRALLDSDIDKVWVAVADDHIVAWIHVFIARRIASAPFCEIGGIVVSPDCRRTGLGRQLVEYAKQWAANLRMPLRVRCNTSREDARRFYEAQGLSLLKQQNIFEGR